MILTVRKDDLVKGIDITDGSNQTSLCGKLVKADFSGARLKVVKSKNIVLEGT